MTERSSARRCLLACACALLLAASLFRSVEAQDSPYAGLQHRELKALSAEERQSYLRGDGMGLALAAELNGLPGPKHVLELADSLRLSPEQRQRTITLFESMRAEAVQLGQSIVNAEERLDRHFRDGAMDASLLAALTTEIGTLQGALRFTHLSAHLTMRTILTEEQIARYLLLRGYTTGREGAHQHQHPQEPGGKPE